MIMIIPMRGVTSFGLFFSSRRRHTSSKRDWSSNVCSSDLAADSSTAASAREVWWGRTAVASSIAGGRPWRKIGRASCRERAQAQVGAVVFEKITVDDARLEAYYDTPNAWRDSFRIAGRMVL